MTFKIFRLRGIERELSRLNSNLELLMIHVLKINPTSSGKMPKDTEEATVDYTDEFADFEAELKEKMGKVPQGVE